MAIHISCPSCGKGYNVDEAHLGRRATCAACQHTFVLAAPAADAAAAAGAAMANAPGAASVPGAADAPAAAAPPPAVPASHAQPGYGQPAPAAIGPAPAGTGPGAGTYGGAGEYGGGAPPVAAPAPGTYVAQTGYSVPPPVTYPAQWPNQYPVGTGKATAALVLGIVAIPTCFGAFPALVCGILAIIFGKLAKGNIARGEMDPKAAGSAKAGVICGIIGIIITVLFWGAYIGFVAWMVTTLPHSSSYP